MVYYLLGLSYLGNCRDLKESRRLANEEYPRLEKIASNFKGENISNDPLNPRFKFSKTDELRGFRRSLAINQLTDQKFSYHHIDPAQEI